MKKNILAFIKEIVPIIAGILIAMYITNWNEDRKDKKYINQMFLSINMELAETNEDIIHKMTLQNSLIDTLNVYKKDNKISLYDIARKVNGINMPIIKMSSWKAISSSKIELMDYEKISSLSNIEDQKELLRLKNESLMTFIYPNINDTGIGAKELLILRMNDIINTELVIQNEIEKIIKN